MIPDEIDTADEDLEAEKDAIEAERESALSNMNQQIIDSLGIKHPIMYENFNICDFASQSKLDKLSVLVLQAVCDAYDLDTSTLFSGKRKTKKPLVSLIISNLANRCPCMQP